MVSSRHGLLQADAVIAQWLLANELAARLGVEGTDAVIGDAREAMKRELEDVIKGLDGPYFSRAQRRQLEVEKLNDHSRLRVGAAIGLDPLAAEISHDEEGGVGGGDDAVADAVVGGAVGVEAF